MTQAMLSSLEKSGVLRTGMARAPQRDQVEANAEDNEVIVFRDFFTARLCFPVGTGFTNALSIWGLKLHQLTLNAFIRLNLFLWLAKTCKFPTTSEASAYLHRVHHQPKVIQTTDGHEAEAQFGCFNFTYPDIIAGPVTVYKNKWPANWALFWFYHKVPSGTDGSVHPLAVKTVELLPTDHLVVEVDETEALKGIASIFRVVSKKYGTCDLVEEFIACNCWPVRASWEVTTWKDDEDGIPMPDFAQSFGLTKEGNCLLPKCRLLWLLCVCANFVLY